MQQIAMNSRNVNIWKKACLDKWSQQCLESNTKASSRKKSENMTEATSVLSEIQKQIVHPVTQSDTLEGLSLRYQTSIDSIIKRNKLYSHEIYYLKQLVIPNPRLGPHKSISYESGQKQKAIQALRTKLKLGADHQNIAQQLLLQTCWNVEAAIKKYYLDLQWERKYADILCMFENKHKPKPYFYQQKAQTY